MARRFVFALVLAAGVAPAAFALPAAPAPSAGEAPQPAAWERRCQLVPTPFGPRERCRNVWVEPRRWGDDDGWRRRRRHRDWDDRGGYDDRRRDFDDRGRGRGYDGRGDGPRGHDGRDWR